MTVGIRMKFPGLGPEEFERLNEQVDPRADPPRGILFHASGPVEGGWGVIDFWESRADFDAFRGRIDLAIQTSGVAMKGALDVKEFAVHETFKP